MTNKEVMQMALDALESWQKTCLDCARPSEELGRSTKPLQALRAKLSEPEPEPVAFQCCEHGDDEWFVISDEYYGISPSRYKYRALYTVLPQRNDFNPDWDAMAVMVEEQQRMAKRIEELEAAPPQREWQGLTKEELAEISEFHFHGALSGREFYDDIEAKLKEKNT